MGKGEDQMKVKELIRVLQGTNQEADVVLWRERYEEGKRPEVVLQDVRALGLLSIRPERF